jgi:spoIIIJ-associated protein
MQSIETEAKTVKEAIIIACDQLKTTEENLKIEIIENPLSKLFSIFSSKKAKIKATLLNTSTKLDLNGSLEKLKDILEDIVKEIDAKATVKINTDEEEPVLNIIGDGGGIFIGKKGMTLTALQFVLNKIRLNKLNDLPHVTVDSESYRSRHKNSLIALSKRLSEKAKKRGTPVSTNPLNSSDRRIVHMEMKKDPELTTWSKGEGNLKRVIIAPKKQP